ncbi:fimbrial chaperone protein [Candidatus Pantoea varia]|uniref:Fimbrial chaperone protein n=1 Tax=Candidatus Pantoea varia TaxID=1881036 RepID=A0A1I5HUR0_9GAMM|nr:fimbria/pilus periplasmic chaperone [Pantoea varia]SFO52068.1 fimbrial chaperone protein [Pantoea varia]
MSRLPINHSSWRSLLFFLFSFLICQSVFASVVMTGSRVIYSSDAKSVDVQLRNNDDFPYVIQAWFDGGDSKSTPATGKAPFVVTPPTFRIAAKDGQVLRIFFTGGNILPQDRESVFYFNFLQVPPGNIAGDKGNQMVVLLKNRMKVFYRPASLKTNTKKIFDYLTFSNISSSGIRITNTSPYYISLSKVAVRNAVAKETAPMIAPFATVDVALTQGKVTGSTQGIEIGLVNDYGATVTHEYPIQK